MTIFKHHKFAIWPILCCWLLLPAVNCWGQVIHGDATNNDNAWWRHTTVYQIYPRSFMDANGDGIGDLQGIISKLDYIQSCGFQTIWVSPFFASPQKDFGYDISNYRSIAPEYGDTNTVNQLITEVHQRGMKIVFDMVMNHTSDQHPWFQESRQSKNNPKSDWYIWRDGHGKHPPNNWKASIGGSGWHYDSLRQQYYWTSFLPFQPDLNYNNPEVKKAMFDNVRYWLSRGVDGFRLDIFNSIYEDSSYHNNPFKLRMIPSADDPDGFFQHMKYTVNTPQDFQFAKDLRAVINEYPHPERFLVGEVFGSPTILRKYLGDKQDGLNLVFLFQTLNIKFKASFFKKIVSTFEKEYPNPYLPTYVFSNHDRKRSISRMGNDVRKAKLLAVFQMTVRGVPFTYQGEEIGMEQAHIPLKKAQDLLAQRYKWIPQFLANASPEALNRDECRTPMQWDSTTNAGFSPPNAHTWLPVNSNKDHINVAMEETDSASLLTLYKRLLALRKSQTDFEDTPTNILPHQPKGVLAYKRGDITVYINFGKHTRKMVSPQGQTLLNLNTYTAKGKLVLPRYSATVVR